MLTNMAKFNSKNIHMKILLNQWDYNFRNDSELKSYSRTDPERAPLSLSKCSRGIYWVLFPVLGFAIAIFVITQTFTIPHKEYYEKQDAFIYSQGNASSEVKKEVAIKLQHFQDGYTARDLNKVDSFMQDLFSKENILILGTMPNEIYSGYESAKRLVHDDWAYWGDVKLLMNNANISSKDSVAWVSTIGYVEFDLSSLLVLPE